MGRFSRNLAAIAALACTGLGLGSLTSQAANDNNGAQDEKQMIQTGYTVAASLGIHLNIANQDPDLVGLGSYIVNVTSACNLCHSPTFITTSFYEPTSNPYFLSPPYSGHQMVDPTVYLGGNQNFGPPVPGYANIISRNLTPDKTGKPEGHTLEEFLQIMQTGSDLDHAHPTCSSGMSPTSCVPPPINGNLLQVMPWPAFRSMTIRQLTAIYTYLSTIPCLVGGPNEPADRCGN